MSRITAALPPIVMALSLFPSTLLATGWDSTRVSSGDFGADGNLDVHLTTGLSEQVELPYGIPVNIEIPSDIGNAIFENVGDTDGDTYPNYSVNHPSDPSAPDVASVTWGGGRYLAITGDTNGDGRTDLLLQPRFESDHLPGILSLAPQSGASPKIDQYLIPEVLGLPVAADAASISLRDTDGDGRADLVVTPEMSASHVRYSSDDGHIAVQIAVTGSFEERAVEPGPSDAVGALPETISVSSSGQLSYRLPLQLPPGIAGHSPALSISYSGGQANGHLGVGWNLAGVSAVHRCPRLEEPETITGSIAGVTLTDQDELCLDGNRLILVSGTHLRGGAVYRPEIDTLTRVTASGPNSTALIFTAELKDGRILELGGSTDSQVEAVGVNADLRWMVNASIDRFGNEISYHYVEDTQTGEHRLDALEYEGAVVQMIYDSNRTDGVTRYRAGSEHRVEHRLREVQVSLGGQRLRDYLLDYSAPSLSTRRERLTSLTLCGYDELGASRECLDPTSISWNEPTTGFDVDAHTMDDRVLRAYISQPMDWNGDGIGDLLTGDFERLRVRLGARNDPGQSVPLVETNEGEWIFSAIAFDADGDGRDEVLYRYESEAGQDGFHHFEWRILSQDGEIRTLPGSGTTGIPLVSDLSGGISPVPLHIDNDGRADLLLPLRQCNEDYACGDVWYRIQNRSLPGSPAFSEPVYIEGLNVSGGYRSAIDLEGDGRHEVLVPYGETFHSLVFDQGFDSEPRVGDLRDTGIPFDRAVFIDANGDGLTDVAAPNSSNRLQLHLNSGRGFVSVDTGIDTSDIFVDYLDRRSAQDYAVKIIDYDGDGLSDLIYPGNGNDATYQVLRSTGDDFVELDTGVPVYVVIVSGTEGIDEEIPNECTDEQLAELDELYDLYDQVLDIYEEVNELCEAGDDLMCIYLFAIVEPALAIYEAEIQTVLDECVGGDGTDPVPRVLSAGARDFQFYDINGDGQRDIIQVDGSSTGESWVVSTQVRSEPDLVVSVTNGLGAETAVEWQPLTNPAVYTKGAGASFPVQDVAGPVFVVSSIEKDNGIGGMNETSYAYEAARRHLKGRGFLGFERQVATDLAAGITTEQRQHQAFPLIGRTYRVEARVSATGQTLSQTEQQWTWKVLAENKTRFPFVAREERETFELDGGQVSAVTVASTYADSYGNLTERVTTTGARMVGGEVDRPTREVTERYTYENDPSSWLLGFPIATHTTWSVPSSGLQNVDVFSEAIRLPGTLRVAEAIRFAGSTAEIVERMDYDSQGRDISVTISSESQGVPQDRTTTQSDFFLGRYPQRIVNALGHVESRTYDPRTGQRTSVMDHDGRTTIANFDVFGRERSQTAPDGRRHYMSHRSCDSTCPPLAATYTLSVSDGQPSSVSYHDVLGRELGSSVIGFDGRHVQSEQVYDRLGRVSRRSLPHYEDETDYWTTQTYDLLGRPLVESRPDGGETTISYVAGSTHGGRVVQQDVAVIAPSGEVTHQVTEQVYDSAGQVIASTDAMGTPLRYRYDGKGQAVWIQVDDNVDTTIELAYDPAGNKVWMSDPDAGQLSYIYNGLGELIEQTDAKGQVTVMVYDQLGRMSSRTDDLGGPLEETQTFVWDAGPNATGQLVSMASPGFEERYDYDAYGRVIMATTLIDERGAPLRRSYSFDPLGRPSTTTYPSGLVVGTAYNAHGYSSKLIDAQSGDLFSRTEAMGPFGTVTEVTLGNGLTTTRGVDPRTGRLQSIRTGSAEAGFGSVQDLSYTHDTIGNVYSRSDLRQELSEAFGYDSLNRLLSATTTGLDSGVRTLTYSYDTLGNLTSKSDVPGVYIYGQGSAGPHAVTAAGGSTYDYDSNGNMTRGEKLLIQWSAYNKPVAISDESSTTAYRYGPRRSRYMRVDTFDSISRTKFYLDSGTIEERLLNDGGRQMNIYASSVLIAFGIDGDDSSISDMSFYYLHRDHLGSIEAVSNEYGEAIQRSVYSPLGSVRTAAWEDGGSQISKTDKGFTGHEQVERLDLVHMGGRMFNTRIGRFLSSDILVPNWSYSQAYSRYSYVYGNSLNKVDPSGYTPEEATNSRSVQAGFQKLVEVRDWYFINTTNSLIEATLFLYEALSLSVMSPASMTQELVGEKVGDLSLVDYFKILAPAVVGSETSVKRTFGVDLDFGKGRDEVSLGKAIAHLEATLRLSRNSSDINIKAGAEIAAPKFSDVLSISSPGVSGYLAFPLGRGNFDYGGKFNDLTSVDFNLDTQLPVSGTVGSPELKIQVIEMKVFRRFTISQHLNYDLGVVKSGATDYVNR